MSGIAAYRGIWRRSDQADSGGETFTALLSLQKNFFLTKMHIKMLQAISKRHKVCIMV
jgi:hypothetical protein